ncbi:MAG: hypothetical protein FJ276_10040 [Planctomycetes bacterium]|nr:hypothetical protein [Planctomycetota bacterium]
MRAKPVVVSQQKVSIPTYAEAGTESLPMFAEERVHQRISGRPYPDCVVVKTQRRDHCDRECTVDQIERVCIHGWSEDWLAHDR